MRIVWSITLLAVVGCGGDGGGGAKDGGGQGGGDLATGDLALPGSGGDGGGGGADMGVLQTVHITGSTTFVGDTAEVSRPRDFSATTYSALMESGSSAFTIYPTTASAAGSVTIGDIPFGRYYLRAGTTYVLSDPGPIVLDRTVLGRPDAVASSSAQAIAAFHIDGLAPWQVGKDQLQLFSAGGAAFEPGLENQIGAPVNEGQTVLAGAQATLPWLIETAKGDVVRITQLVAKTLADGTSYHVASKIWSGSFDQGSVTMPVDGTFATVPQDQSLTLAWSRSQFRARAVAANAGAHDCIDAVDLAAQPALQAHGNFSDEPDVLIVEATPGVTDLNLSGLAYGNPFPPSWGLVALVSTTCAVDVAGPAGAAPLVLHGSSSVFDTLSRLTASGAAPRIAPVVAPTIAGHDALAYQANVGLTPTIAWKKPTTGEPTVYWIDLYRIDETGSSATAVKIASISSGKTGATSLRVPPDLLALNKRYAAKITAQAVVDASASGSAVTVIGSFSP
jgi:hypothetical protein